MITSFKNKATEDIFYGRDTKQARKACPSNLWTIAIIALEELRIPPGNKLEALKGDKKGQHSIRINNQYRICFIWTNTGAKDVEITDYH
jgi:proteic killer suppression protein